MASKRTSEVQRQALADDLRRACSEGDLRPGDLLPTVRELQERYRLSPRTVTNQLRMLVSEGILRTVPRVGTFVADVSVAEPETYVMLLRSGLDLQTRTAIDRVRRGFEGHVSALGAASVCMELDDALARHAEGALPAVAGFLLAMPDRGEDLARLGDASTARVWWTSAPGSAEQTGAVIDRVTADHRDGGRAAAHHLWRRGHRRIAFLGLHTASDDHPSYRWSKLREQGWLEVMHRHGASTDSKLFIPDRSPASYDEEVEVAKAVSHRLLIRRDITAVVCASQNAARGLVEVLREADVPAEGWPAFVAFEEVADFNEQGMTTIRVPCEDIGHEAAQLLWDRRHGRVKGGSVDRRLPMPVIRRTELLAHRAWAPSADLASDSMPAESV